MFKLILLFFVIPNSLSERSFTMVLDTTKSMKDEIFAIRANIGPVVNAANQSNFGNYVLITFKDSAVEGPFTTKSAWEFTSRLNSLQTSGGYDCPENSLAGIEAALRASERQSAIFVFTDAYAKDYKNFHAVESLCRESHSQVMIFLSGNCESSLTHQLGNVEVYYDVARACAGAVFRFDTAFELRNVFKYMIEITSTEWTNITPYEKFGDYKQISFSVDSFTTDLMLAVSGRSPTVEIIRSSSQVAGLETVFHTSLSLVVRLRKPEVGEYTAYIRGQGPIAATFYDRNSVPFEFGFSTRAPRNIQETSRRPIAGFTNFILINVDSSIKLRSVEWLNLGDSAKQVLLLNQTPSGCYISSIFVEQGKTFRFWIIGEEVSTQREIKGPSRILAPQSTNVNGVTRIKPQGEILDKDVGLVDFGSELTLACKIAAYPKPEIHWENEANEILPSETVILEIPSVYISYVTITNVTNNCTLSCNARNEDAVVYDSFPVFVNRTFSFDVIQSPEDASVEFGSEHSLYCQVDAYPEATVKWYLNDSLIDTYTNSRVFFEDDALVIKNMGFEDIGSYVCTVSNNVETQSFKATVEITGVEAPKIGEIDTEINLKPGNAAEIKCRISDGKPAPGVTWKYKAFDGSESKYLPDGVLDIDGKLVIASVKKSQGGIYTCVASNVIGEDAKEVTVKIQYPPVIRNSERESMVVKEGDQVHLFCDVEATPEATVRWEMSQDDVIVAFDHRHRTDESHTHHFMALWNDAGNYHCIAENDAGKAERTVILDVLVLPYIETPKSEEIYATIGGSVTLPCNVLYGNPTPTVRWDFTAKDSGSRTLNRDSSTSALHLYNVSRSDEGSYLCITENRIGTDRIKYHLIIQ